MEFLTEHGLELFTTFLGLIYLYYEYKASIWLWLLGIIMPMIFLRGPFFIPEGTYSTALFTFSGTTHIIFAIIPAPKEPLKHAMLSKPSPVISSDAHFP